MKGTCSFANGGYSNLLDMILLGWLPISKRIDFCIIKLAHKDLHVTPFPSYLKLSFKKLSRYLRNKDEFLITASMDFHLMLWMMYLHFRNIATILNKRTFLWLIIGPKLRDAVEIWFYIMVIRYGTYGIWN